MMDGPLSATLYAAAFCTETTMNDVTITTTAGMPMESVSLSAGSRRLMRGRMRMPLRESAGIWMASCTNTPSGLPMAIIHRAASGFAGATSAYATKVMMTMMLLNTGAMDDHRKSRCAFSRPDTMDPAE